MQELTKGLDRFASGDYAAPGAPSSGCSRRTEERDGGGMDTMAANRLGAGDWRTQQDKDFLKSRRMTEPGSWMPASFPRPAKSSSRRWRWIRSMASPRQHPEDRYHGSGQGAGRTAPGRGRLHQERPQDRDHHLREVLKLQNDHKQARDLLTRIERLEKEAWEKMQQERRNIENAEIYYRRGMAFFQRNIYIDAVDSFRVSWSYLQNSRRNTGSTWHKNGSLPSKSPSVMSANPMTSTGRR
jgi:tetratricopeptide (TPR) repeat protein